MTPSTSVLRVCKDLWLHPVWGEEAPGGWYKVAAGTRRKDAGIQEPQRTRLTTRGKGSSRVCCGHGGEAGR